MCSIFGVSVFNVCEVGFDSPTKLVSGGPRFMVDPTLRHCTFSHGLDEIFRSAGIALPSREPGRSP